METSNSLYAYAATHSRESYEIRNIFGAGYCADVRVGRRVRDVPRRRIADSFASTFCDDFSGDSFIQQVEVIASSRSPNETPALHSNGLRVFVFSLEGCSAETKGRIFVPL
jgi:hypothetical protein